MTNQQSIIGILSTYHAKEELFTFGDESNGASRDKTTSHWQKVIVVVPCARRTHEAFLVAFSLEIAITAIIVSLEKAFVSV
jgi:tRNA(Leu) C34 or U34 (ribose-2'-O)-methylase TrmL